jgi:hypothetical protein
MGSERFAGFFDCLHNCMTELFVSEMFPHCIHQFLPERLTALFMDRFIADDCKLVRTRRDENENSITFRRFVHSEAMEFFLRGEERIAIQLSALNENANLTGSIRFGIADRLYNLLVLEFTEKFFRSHRITSWSPLRRHPQFRRRR